MVQAASGLDQPEDGATSSTSAWRTKGLVTKPAMPTWRQRSISSWKAEALKAMIGTRNRNGRACAGAVAKAREQSPMRMRASRDKREYGDTWVFVLIGGTEGKHYPVRSEIRSRPCATPSRCLG